MRGKCLRPQGGVKKKKVAIGTGEGGTLASTTHKGEKKRPLSKKKPKRTVYDGAEKKTHLPYLNKRDGRPHDPENRGAIPHTEVLIFGFLCQGRKLAFAGVEDLVSLKEERTET